MLLKFYTKHRFDHFSLNTAVSAPFHTLTQSLSEISLPFIVPWLFYFMLFHFSLSTVFVVVYLALHSSIQDSSLSHNKKLILLCKSVKWLIS